MPDIVQLGIILAVAGLLFFGLGVWYALGRERVDVGNQGASPEPEPSIDPAEVTETQHELAQARQYIATLEQDLSQARHRLESSLDSDPSGVSSGSARAGVEVDPELGEIYPIRPEDVDDLTKIRGVGKALARQLNLLGVFTLAQIANWEKEQVEAFSTRLSFKDRIVRDDWVGQAKRL